MKRKLLAALIFGLIASIPLSTTCYAFEENRLYETQLVVSEISDGGFIGCRKDHYEFCVNFTGKWRYGDIVDVVMHDNGTHEKYDDYVVEILNCTHDPVAERNIILSRIKDNIERNYIDKIDGVKTVKKLNGGVKSARTKK